LRTLGIVLGTIAVFAAATVQAADGTLDLSWKQCSPVISGISSPGDAAIYATVHGIDQAHKAYEILIAYGNAAQNVPDAWRFDPGGCQGSSRIAMDHVAPDAVAASCPTFQPGTVLTVEVVGFVPAGDPSGYPSSNQMIKFQLADALGNAVDSNPATRYFLARFQFDHSHSVPGPTMPGSCGGIDQAMCFKLMRAGYIDTSGNEHFWRSPWAPGPFPTLTFNSSEACAGETPALPSTWGQIRHQYR
jgi:hypothetical protein